MLIYNAIRTPKGTVVESTHKHDCRMVEGCMVDGGLSYLRRGGGPYADISVDYEPGLHDTHRWIAKWGTKGIDGDLPLTHKRVAEMDTRHIEAVLDTQDPAPGIAACMRTELEQRKKEQNDG